MKCLFCNKKLSCSNNSYYMNCKCCKNNFHIRYAFDYKMKLNWVTIEPSNYEEEGFHIALCYKGNCTELFSKSIRILVLPYIANINPDNFYQKLSLMKTFL